MTDTVPTLASMATRVAVLTGQLTAVDYAIEKWCVDSYGRFFKAPEDLMDCLFSIQNALKTSAR